MALGQAAGTAAALALDAAAPVQVEGLPSNPLGIAAGAMHTCAVLADRSVYCWGQNLHGQLGDGTTTNRTVPTQVGTDTDWATAAAGTSASSSRSAARPR